MAQATAPVLDSTMPGLYCREVDRPDSAALGDGRGTMVDKSAEERRRLSAAWLNIVAAGLVSGACFIASANSRPRGGASALGAFLRSVPFMLWPGSDFTCSPVC